MSYELREALQRSEGRESELTVALESKRSGDGAVVEERRGGARELQYYRALENGA